jgi:[protein-PII] uridylyltransferase
MTIRRDTILNLEHFNRSLSSSDNPLTAFRAALKQGQEAIKQSHLAHVPAARVVTGRAWLIDQLLLQAWRLHLPYLSPSINAALVAVGGYGRGELHPASDIDLMILLDKSDPSAIGGFVESLLRFLWDMGLEVGHSVRTIKDCVREAKNDITVATNLMEARLLDGDKTLFERMRSLTHALRIWPSPKFFAAKWAEQIERHHCFDDTAYNLEPNVKEGPGGLRDIQMIIWVTQRHFDTVSLHDLVKRRFLTEKEYRALIKGRNFLWRVRSGLHYAADRREDRLLFDYQRILAAQFGYRDKRGILAVEQFMKRYYRTIKELSLLNEILLQHFQEALLSRGRLRIIPINRRFQSCNGFLDTVQARVFEHSSFALLELFLIMQQQPAIKGVRAQTIRLIRANLHRINQKFRRDLACRSLFMEILRQPRGLTQQLRRMNAYGVLGAYLPAFGKIVGQMQHDLFHVYTVDEHSLFVVRNLRRFTLAVHAHEYPLASELIKGLVKPERLYLGGLFHDIAKGRGGDHSKLGAEEAENFCRRHGLSEYDTRFISWLVSHHLMMSRTAQHQDISDPAVVLEFARQVGDQEHLDNLYLLTVADMRATSPNVWNTWKGRLLSQLYSATTRLLRRGITTPLDLRAHISDLRAGAMAILQPNGIGKAILDRFWENLDSDYFLRYDAENLAWHAENVSQVMVEQLPLVAVRSRQEYGACRVLVYTPDRNDLFAVLTGGFDRLNLSIVDARIHTTHDGYALDTFAVLDHEGKIISDPKALTNLQTTMRQQLLKPQAGREWHATHLPRTLKHFPIKTQVNFESTSDGKQTIMEVTAQDRPGLLHQVAQALVTCRVNLVAAKVSTYGERAEDVFFLNSRAGGPITDQGQLDCVAEQIHTRLGRSETANGVPVTSSRS